MQRILTQKTKENKQLSDLVNKYPEVIPDTKKTN